MTYSKAKTSPNQKAELPVILVTGLLGSGKTTLLRRLIQQKPESQTWGIIVNEFGELGIDGSVLQQPGLVVKEISGGCICCSAQRLLSQTLSEMATQDLDLLLIEPTGLGHPAQMLDAIQQAHTARPLKLTHNLCLVDATRFNDALWQKSAVFRDLVHLADTVLISKTDLISPQQAEQQVERLTNLAQTQPTIRLNRQDEINLNDLKTPITRPGFILLQAKQHLTQPGLVTEFQSEIQGVIQSHQQIGTPFSLSWIFSPKVQFNRTALKAWLVSPPGLVRLKGLIRTGKNWQLLNWVNGDLTFEDMAWRQDSRLEMIFETQPNLKELEKNLAQTLQIRDH
jgi:G3E family GTPase